MAKKGFNLNKVIKAAKAIQKASQPKNTANNAPIISQRNTTPPVMQAPAYAPPGPAPVSTERKLKRETLYVAGVYYHENSMKMLATFNPDWRKSAKTLTNEGKVGISIPHYTYINKPVKIVHEPNNEYSPKALMVMIAGEHVGYIKGDDNAHMWDVLNNHSLKYMTAEIFGAECKTVYNDGSVLTSEGHLGIKLKIGYV